MKNIRIEIKGEILRENNSSFSDEDLDDFMSDFIEFTENKKLLFYGKTKII